jgi:hypothetical protein
VPVEKLHVSVASRICLISSIAIFNKPFHQKTGAAKQHNTTTTKTNKIKFAKCPQTKLMPARSHTLKAQNTLYIQLFIIIMNKSQTPLYPFMTLYIKKEQVKKMEKNSPKKTTPKGEILYFTHV